MGEHNVSTNDHDLLIQISTKLDIALQRMDQQDGKIAVIEARTTALENWKASMAGVGQAVRTGTETFWRAAAFVFGFSAFAIGLYTFIRGGH